MRVKERFCILSHFFLLANDRDVIYGSYYNGRLYITFEYVDGISFCNNLNPPWEHFGMVPFGLVPYLKKSVFLY